MSMVDFFFYNYAKAPSILHKIALSLGDDGTVYVCIFIGALAFTTYRPIFIDDDYTVYCPPLADELWATKSQEMRDELIRNPTGPTIG
jgi:hypothetical protein